MNILFLTIAPFSSIESHSLYSDLLRCFRDHGHDIYAVSPSEKRFGKKTELIHEKGTHVLHVETGDVTGSGNLIKKGLAQMSIEPIFIRAIKQHFPNTKFDLVLYSTPPITFCKVVEFVKRRDNAKTYLLLKDIFPQNAVDIGMMSKTGVKGILYKHFRRVEKKLYSISDRIGCMSQANVDYVLKHNPEIDPKKVEICPNSIEIQDMSVSPEERSALRDKYGIPQDKKVFVYGGNLGKPQGIPFIIECLKKLNGHPEAYFLIVGDGTEFSKLQKFFDEEKPANMKLLNRLPKEDYDRMVAACDVGLIFLDHRFTIPNFPSRLLSYMQAGLPVLAATDPNTDIGKVITEGGFGWWCESNDANAFTSKVEAAMKADITPMQKAEKAYLLENYTVERAYGTIVGYFNKA
ncbi:MAG: glycosyltransferase family 4 protein [Clostridiales bacterium]|nr:glycosyltransferase family 4 protein [Clostridiales bacterium]